MGEECEEECINETTCIYCKKDYESRNNLTVHLSRNKVCRIKRGVRKMLECPKCKKEFARKDTLMKHIKTHGPKPPSKSEQLKALTEKYEALLAVNRIK
jgi:uncharacterized Zn-finger protein